MFLIAGGILRDYTLRYLFWNFSHSTMENIHRKPHRYPENEKE
jgi:hypothetical protein